MVNSLIFANYHLDLTTCHTQLLQRLKVIHLIVLFKLSLDCLMVLEGQKVFKYSRIPDLRILDQVISEKLQHSLLFLNILGTGLEPAIFLKP